MNSPTVSVIINCFNSSKYLREALDSVISQTLKKWEIIFWDNQSTDESATIVKSYNDERIKYFFAPVHTPLSAGRNAAVAKANGKYLAFLDCDDVWQPEKLARQVAAFDDAEVGIVYCKFSIIDEAVTESARSLKKYYQTIACKPHNARNIFNDLLEGNFIIFSSVMLRRDLFSGTGGFNPAFSQNEDYEILLKYAQISTAVCIDYSGVGYRIHAVNNSHLNAEKNFQENAVIFSGLPPAKSVRSAIVKNQTRYGLFQMLIQGKIEGILRLSLRSIPVIGSIIRKRFSR